MFKIIFSMTFLQKAWAFIAATTVWTSTMLAPSVPFLVAVSGLVALDTLSGIIVSRYAGEPFSSRKFFRLWTKCLHYGGVILMSLVIEYVFFKKSPIAPMHELPIMYLVASGVAFNEIVSINENYRKMTGRSFLSFISRFVAAFLPDRSKIADILESELSNTQQSGSSAPVNDEPK